MAHEAQTAPDIAVSLPDDVAAPVTETTPAADATATAGDQSPKADEPKTEPQVDLKAWARTSRENRELKAKLSDLETKLTEASQHATQEAREAALIEALKQPGVAKLLSKAGRTFEDVIQEYTSLDDDLPDPKTAEALERVAKLEAERDAEKKAAAERDSKAAADKHAAELAAAVSDIQKEVLEPKAEELVTDEKDPRYGTPRWALASDNESVSQAFVAVRDYIAARGKPVTREQADTLLLQALDQIAVHKAKQLEPVLSKLRKATTNPPTSSATQTEQSGIRLRHSETPTDTAPRATISNRLSNGLPVAPQQPERFSAGPGIRLQYRQ